MCKSDYIQFCFRARDITPLPAALPWLTMVQFFKSTLQNAAFKDGCHSPWWQCQSLGERRFTCSVGETCSGGGVGAGGRMWKVDVGLGEIAELVSPSCEEIGSVGQLQPARG